MHLLPPSERRKVRRLAPAVTVALISVALTAPVASAQSPITVDAAKDSVQVTGLPLGLATLQVSRPDRKTGNPVVTGQFQGFALFGMPFAANTTAPTLLNPSGDCWQKGALSLSGNLGLTPDILPGDTVSVVGGPSLVVPAQTSTGTGIAGGPISGCDTLSLWGHNAVKTAGFTSAGGDLAITGRAQPGVIGVTVSAEDANGVETAPVAATLATDGAYTATIPAAALEELSDGTLTVAADYSVPDVASGTAADIGGLTLGVDKDTPDVVEPVPSEKPPASNPPAPKIALHGLVAKKKISRKGLSAGKLRASFIVPTGVQYVRVRLSLNGATKAKVIARAAAAGTRQTIALQGVRKPRRGQYTITVLASPVSTMFVGDVLRAQVRVR